MITLIHQVKEEIKHLLLVTLGDRERRLRATVVSHSLGLCVSRSNTCCNLLHETIYAYDGPRDTLDGSISAVTRTIIH
jgi:hypothetical protein